MPDQGYPRYYDLDDVPARKQSELHFPEVYKPGKGFVPYYDRFKFDSSATPSDEATVKAMILRLEEGRKAAQGAPPPVEPGGAQPPPAPPTGQGAAAVPAPAAVELSAGHDVTGEARDPDGKWTAGGEHADWSGRWDNRKYGHEATFSVVAPEDQYGNIPLEARLTKASLDPGCPRSALAIAMTEEMDECPKEFVFENLRTSHGEQEDAFGITGTGHAKAIIEKAGALFLGALKRYAPKVVFFSAAEKSRERLYEMLAKRIKGLVPYSAFRVSEGSSSTFAIIRNDSVDQFKNVIEQVSADSPVKLSAAAK